MEVYKKKNISSSLWMPFMKPSLPYEATLPKYLKWQQMGYSLLSPFFDTISLSFLGYFNFGSAVEQSVWVFMQFLINCLLYIAKQLFFFYPVEKWQITPQLAAYVPVYLQMSQSDHIDLGPIQCAYKLQSNCLRQWAHVYQKRTKK